MTLNSLDRCVPPFCNIEIIIVINHGENENPEIKIANLETAKMITEWIKTNQHDNYHVIKAFDLPHKKAGVGLARKIGMDEAARRFEMIGEQNGIIVCFDADCLCEPNFLVEIFKAYQQNPLINAALVYFEHYTDQNTEIDIREAIINYELHLRYYVQALKLADFPFAYHTVGSCITVSSAAYKKQGGMNLRKAGEDFYFLQKVFPLGNITNIVSTKVLPSPRISNRVPFGTGKAVSEFIKSKNQDYKTYNPKTFLDFKKFNTSVVELWKNHNPQNFMEEMPESLQQYLHSIDFAEQAHKIHRNSGEEAVFVKSLYNWFNGFKALKYVHFSRDLFYENIDVLEAANWIINENFGKSVDTKPEALEMMRTLDKSNN